MRDRLSVAQAPLGPLIVDPQSDKLGGQSPLFCRASEADLATNSRRSRGSGWTAASPRRRWAHLRAMDLSMPILQRPLQNADRSALRRQVEQTRLTRYGCARH